MKLRRSAIVAIATGFFAVAAHADVCSVLESATARVASAGTVAVALVPAVVKLAGLMALEHSSGLMIAALPSGMYMANTIGPIGSAVALATSTPIIVGGAVVVVTIGGVSAACYFIGSKG